MVGKKVAIITGAASGIGLATAKRLLDSGWTIVTCDLNPAPPEWRQKAGWADHLEMSVCDVPALGRLIRRAAEVGEIQALVNNAGVPMVARVEDVGEEDWDRCLDTNVKAAFFGTQFVIPYLRQRGGGAVVNVASNAGLLPRAHDPVYSISKLSLVGLTKSLALCLSPDRIRVNCVCPGPVSETGMVNADLDQAEDRAAAEQVFINAAPIAAACGRMIEPGEVAASIEYLLSDAALMVTGTAIAIDGGKSLGVPPARKK